MCGPSTHHTYVYIPAGVRIAFEDDDITCVSEADPVWGIVWSQTAAGSTDTQRCPGGVTYAAGMHKTRVTAPLWLHMPVSSMACYPS